MSEKLNLRKIERTAAASVFRSGIVDIGVGLVWIVFSLAMIFNDYRYYLDMLFLIPVIFMFLAVKYIFTPRAGFVKLSSKRRHRNLIFIIVSTVFLVIMVSLTLFGKIFGSDLLIHPRLLISFIIFFICVAIAYIFTYHRMYLYAFLLTGAFNWSEEIREHQLVFSESGYAYLIVAILAVIIGTGCLIKFLKDNPVSREDITYGKDA